MESKVKSNISIQEKYQKALEITDINEAVDYFESLVDEAIKLGYSREEAVQIEKDNITYLSSFQDPNIQVRVAMLYGGIESMTDKEDTLKRLKND